MARIIQTVSASGGSSSAGVTLDQAEAAALDVFRENAAYEYISTIKLTASEVNSFQFTGLDTTTYSGFRIETQRLALGSTSGTFQSTWTIHLMYGTTLENTNNAYFNDFLRYGYASQATGAVTSQNSWTYAMGYAGYPSSVDFTADLNLNPTSGTSSQDATFMMQMVSVKTGGYGAQSGLIAGCHNYVVPNINGIRFTNNGYFRKMGVGGDALINLYGKRAR